jgi:hypothetical protein
VNLLGFLLEFEVAGFKLRALTFELLDIRFRGAQRLLAGQQEIPLTTSPIWPSFSTRSRSTTCIV